MNREREFIKNTVILGFGNFFPKLLSFITIPIVSGYLTKTEYGTYDYINSLVTFFAQLATLQVSTAVFRYLIESRNNKEKCKSIITNAYVFSVPLMIIVSLFPLLLFRNEIILIKILIIFYFLIYVLYGMTGQVARGLSYNKIYAVSSVVNAVINAICIVVLVYGKRQGLVGMLLALTLSYFLSTLVIFCKLKLWKYVEGRLLSISVIRELLAYSLPMIPNSISSWILKLSDRIILTSVLGAEANAIYGMANKIPSLLSLVQTVFVMAWQENASIAVNDRDADIYYTKIFKRIFVLLSTSSMLLISVTPWLFRILIKGDYGESYLQIPILVIADFFYCLCAFQGGIYIAHKKTKQVAFTTAAAAVINFLVNVSFVRCIGVTAASISTLIAYLILYCFRCYNIKSFQSVSYSLHTQLLFIPMFVITLTLFVQKNNALDIVNVSINLIIFFILNRDFVELLLKKVKKEVK